MDQPRAVEGPDVHPELCAFGAIRDVRLLQCWRRSSAVLNVLLYSRASEVASWFLIRWVVPSGESKSKVRMRPVAPAAGPSGSAGVGGHLPQRLVAADGRTSHSW